MDNSSEINVILHGGPQSLSIRERVRHVENTSEKVKLLLGNHYEHFEPTAETERRLGRDLLVYVWTGCTYVAE
jgi:hypothetical protein